LQPAPPGRSRDRFISLPDELQGDGQMVVPELSPTIFEDLPGLDVEAGTRGRITVYCVAESLDRKALELRLRERGGAALLHQYPDVLYGLYESAKVPGVLWLCGVTQCSRCSCRVHMAMWTPCLAACSSQETTHLSRNCSGM
jgi:hypothetical protein